MPSSFFRLLVVIGAFLVLLCMIGLLVRRPLRLAGYALVNMGSGLGVLALLQWLLPSLAAPVNLLTLAAACGLGVPGVALAVALRAVL